MSEIWAVIPAAGVGSRMGSGVKKQFLQLEGKEILALTLEVFEKVEEISGVILVTGKADIETCREICERYAFSKVKIITEGGANRQESVLNGLSRVPHECGAVIIHDGARPFVTAEKILETVEKAEKEGGCILAVPVKDTIKMVTPSGEIERTPERALLYQAQTPQTFRFPEILDAHRRAVVMGDFRCTDDAQIVEKYMDMKVVITEGSPDNIKITTPTDLNIAREIIRERQAL